MMIVAELALQHLLTVLHALQICIYLMGNVWPSALMDIILILLLNNVNDVLNLVSNAAVSVNAHNVKILDTLPLVVETTLVTLHNIKYKPQVNVETVTLIV